MVKYTKTFNKLKRKPFKNSRITRPSRKMYARQQKQTFCKVCYDCHKPPEMYLSHRPKVGYGPDAITVCPTLLNTRCPKCHKFGHTGGNCMSGQEIPKPRPQPYYTIRKYVPPPTPRTPPTPTTSPTTSNPVTNLFSVLDDHDEVMDENGNDNIHSIDILPVHKPLSKTTLTYSQIVAMKSNEEKSNALNDVVRLFKKNIGILEKTKEQTEEKKEEKEEEKKEEKEEEKEEKEEEKEIEFNELKDIQGSSWADITEEEDEETYYSDSELNSMNILCV